MASSHLKFKGNVAYTVCHAPQITSEMLPEIHPNVILQRQYAQRLISKLLW